jgi:restriction system protein
MPCRIGVAVRAAADNRRMLRMAKNSLFAILLRSPWWASAAIAVALWLLGAAVLSDPFRAMAILSGVPFAVIGAIAARRQWHEPSQARVAETREALARMSWPTFAALLEQGFRRDGYTVSRSKSAAIDFDLTRNGRRTLVCARRWKSARIGLEALRALQTERDATDVADALYVGLGDLTDTALPFAREHGIAVWHAGELARSLRRLPVGDAPKR